MTSGYLTVYVDIVAFTTKATSSVLATLLEFIFISLADDKQSKLNFTKITTKTMTAATKIDSNSESEPGVWQT